MREAGPEGSRTFRACFPGDASQSSGLSLELLGKPSLNEVSKISSPARRQWCSPALCLFLLSRTQMQQEPNPNPVPSLHLGARGGGS